MLTTYVFLVFLRGLSPATPAWVPDYEDIEIFLRGDANNDKVVNVTDAISINSFLFAGGPEPPCMNQADANNDGLVNVSDSTFILSWLYNGGSQPPSPGPFNTVCVADDAPYPGCAVRPCR